MKHRNNKNNTINKELNDFRKLFVWENLKFPWEIFSLKCPWKIDGTWHTLSAMLRSRWCHISVIIATVISYWCLSDVIELSFCQDLSSKVSNSIVAMVIKIWRHAIHDSRRAWHIVYATLLSSYKWVAAWNWYNGKVWFSPTCNSFLNNVILSYLVKHFWMSEKAYKHRHYTCALAFGCSGGRVEGLLRYWIWRNEWTVHKNQ